jgi:hypothetical protein
MSEVKVNKITPTTNCGTVTLGDSGDTIAIPAGVNLTSGGALTNSGTITNTGSITGVTITGTIDNQVNWQTDSIKTTGFTAVAGEGYFCNTTSAAFTVTLPASPSAGDLVGIKDYANTADTNNITIGRNGSNIEGAANDFLITVEGGSITLIYVDATQGWLSTAAAKASDISEQALFITATGGTITTSGDYKIHSFTGPGTFTVCSVGNPAGSNSVSYLVIAGGGGGGATHGGGAGAGGFREGKASSDSYTASPLNAPAGLPVIAQGYPITVGGGGAGAPVPSNQIGSSGVNSTFSTITSAGGGGAGGGGSGDGIGLNGGSGGGGGNTVTSAGGTGNTPPVSPPQGQNGGAGNNPGGTGGGGGAGAAGQNSPGGNTAGNGGVGSTTSINGTPTARAGGGGGKRWWSTQGAGGLAGGPSGGRGAYVSQSGGSPGAANTGGGGGGGLVFCWWIRWIRNCSHSLQISIAMSEFKTNKISPRSGTTQTIGDSGDSVSTSSGSTINNAGTITTAGITGGTINNTTGSIYLRGEVDWQPSDIKTASFTATDNQGFFVNTTSGEITVTLPASPSAGDVVGIKDYANTFDTNKCILNANGNKIQGSTTNFEIIVEGSSIIIIYVDATQGWVITDASKAADITEGLLILLQQVVQ